MDVRMVVQADARQMVGNGIVFPVNVANFPVATDLSESLTEVVAFRQQLAQMSTVATPAASHHHDDEKGV